MKTKTKNTIAEQLTECMTRAVTYANESLNRKDVDQAARALEVCKQSLELLDLLSLVATEPDA